MPRLTHLVLASGMAVAASAQSSSASVTQVFLPMADQQALVASVIGEVCPSLSFPIQRSQANTIPP